MTLSPRFVLVALAAFATAAAGCAAPAASTPPAAAPKPTSAAPQAKTTAAPAPTSPARVMLDGDAVALPHTLAIRLRDAYIVYRFNHDRVTCAQMLGNRTVAPGEVEVRVSAGPGGGMADGIGIDAFASLATSYRVELVAEPAREGDRVAINVPRAVTLRPTVGAWKDREVVVEGLFEAPFCGTRP